MKQKTTVDAGTTWIRSIGEKLTVIAKRCCIILKPWKKNMGIGVSLQPETATRFCISPKILTTIEWLIVRSVDTSISGRA